MKIAFIDVQNFRKLRCVRIELADKQTVFVGANNSGKTTAMHALDKFLKQPKEHQESTLDEESSAKWFVVEDFTLSLWGKINEIAANWEQMPPESEPPTDLVAWDSLLPSLDVWLEVGSNEYHYVHKLIPTLDWSGGYLGIRLRLQPKDINSLYRDYLASRLAAKQTLERAFAKRQAQKTEQETDSAGSPSVSSTSEAHIQKAFWPQVR